MQLLQPLVEELRLAAAVACLVASEECERVALRAAGTARRMRVHAANLARIPCRVCQKRKLSVNHLGVCSARCRMFADASPFVSCTICRESLMLRFDWQRREYSAICCGRRSALPITHIAKDL